MQHWLCIPSLFHSEITPECCCSSKWTIGIPPLAWIVTIKAYNWDAYIIFEIHLEYLLLIQCRKIDIARSGIENTRAADNTQRQHSLLYEFIKILKFFSRNSPLVRSQICWFWISDFLFCLFFSSLLFSCVYSPSYWRGSSAEEVASLKRGREREKEWEEIIQNYSCAICAVLFVRTKTGSIWTIFYVSTDWLMSCFHSIWNMHCIILH